MTMFRSRDLGIGLSGPVPPGAIGGAEGGQPLAGWCGWWTCALSWCQHWTLFDPTGVAAPTAGAAPPAAQTQAPGGQPLAGWCGWWTCALSWCQHWTFFDPTGVAAPTGGADRISTLKSQLSTALAQVEAQEAALQESIKPQTEEQVETLRQQLRSALSDLDERSAELRSKNESSSTQAAGAGRRESEGDEGSDTSG